jgi:predicted nucleotide-binding protein (sugar kinase/HSP70/actin superfamily)
LKYFARELRGKPHLNIEIDEHTADAGVITRCEAFIDSISATTTTQKPQQATTSRTTRHRNRIPANIYVPNMSDHTHLIAAAFKRCGISMSRLPETDDQSIDIGRRHASGKECYPYLLTTGDIIKKTRDDDFDPDGSAFMMPSGTGPCRFGQYNVLMAKTLEDIGCGQVPVMSPVQDSRLYRDISSYAKEVPAYIWKAIVAGDILAKHLHQSRPYEKDKGSAKRLYDKHLELMSQAIRNPRGNIERQIAEMSREFQQLPKNLERKPIIGIVGEIYVRSNRFANDNFIEKIEALGVEAHLSPISEWIHYIGFTGSRKALRNKDLLTTLSFFIRRHIQDNIETHYMDICRKSLNNGHDPHIGTILRHAAPYIHDSLEGEAILSIGRSVEFARNNTAGIVNLMPFGCMPGSIVSAMLRQITDNYGIPHISIAYDGTESPVTQIQIEAFVAQAKAYDQEKTRKKRGIIK